MEHQELLNELRGRFTEETVREVVTLHVQLGHPSPQLLAKGLTEQGKDKDVVECAKLYRCGRCLARKRPPLVRVARLTSVGSFNDVVDTDIFFLLWRGKKRKVMVIMVEFSRYEVDAVITKEKAAKEIKILEKKWCSWAGPPKTCLAPT